MEGAWMCNFFCFDGEQPNPYDFAMRQMDSLDAAVKRIQIKVANTAELYKAVNNTKLPH
jgi:membrane dipeptidase